MEGLVLNLAVDFETPSGGKPVPPESADYSGPPCDDPACPCGSLSVFVKGYGEVSERDLEATVPFKPKRIAGKKKAAPKKKK